MIELRDVSKSFDTTEGAGAVTVLSGLTFSAEQGEAISILGPSGSGKSTLLNILGALDTPTHGVMLLEGKDLGSMDERHLAEIRNRRIGFVFQAHHLLPQCSVLENVLVPTLASRDPAMRSEAGARARGLLDRVGLGGRLDHRPAQLSGGERQRAAVVRALINEPGILLADEPTGALDRASAANLADLLIELNREMRVTLILVTHSLDLARRAGRILELREGKLHPATLTP